MSPAEECTFLVDKSQHPGLRIFLYEFIDGFFLRGRIFLRPDFGVVRHVRRRGGEVHLGFEGFRLTLQFIGECYRGAAAHLDCGVSLKRFAREDEMDLHRCVLPVGRRESIFDVHGAFAVKLHVLKRNHGA